MDAKKGNAKHAKKPWRTLRKSLRPLRKDFATFAVKMSFDC